jgi:hypothetical protein
VHFDLEISANTIINVENISMLGETFFSYFGFSKNIVTTMENTYEHETLSF